MNCPKCGGFDLEVIDSRYCKYVGLRRRRRECVKCHTRVSTYEISIELFEKLSSNERSIREQIENTRNFLAKLEAIGSKSGDSSDGLPADSSDYWSDV